MKNKKVSIIIPAYNEEKYLPACLESISNLIYPEDNIEVIMIDNGSVDRTRDIAESYGVKVLFNDSKNISGLRNLGVRESTGDIIAFIDADCAVSREWLKNAAKYFVNGRVSAWGAPPIIPKDPTWVQKTWFLVRQKEKPIQEVGWLESMNLFVRKEQFEAIGGFNENLVTCEDVDFCYRIRKYGRIISDKSAEVVHFGEARTIKEFLRKEIWRGRSSLDGIRSHGFSMEELPSLSIPLYFSILFPAFFAGFFFFSNTTWLVAGIILFLLPSMAVIFRMRRKKIGLVELMRLMLLLQLYFYARTIAVLILSDDGHKKKDRRN